jgi:hypothetical protein
MVMNKVLRLFLNEFERAVYDGVADGSYALGFRRNTARLAIQMPRADRQADAWWEITGRVIRPDYGLNESIPVSKLFRYMIRQLYKNILREEELARVKRLKDSALSVLKPKEPK